MNSRMSYDRVGRRCHGGSKGFRLNIHRRFSVQGLRSRFIYLFRQLSRWRSSYGRGLRFIIRKMGLNGNMNNMMKSGSARGSRRSSSLVMPREVRLTNTRLRPSLGRSNSFYAEAISDCLDFIKRSSLSDVDQKQLVPHGDCHKLAEDEFEA